MRVLIADDHAPTLDALREALDAAPSIEVCACAVDAPSAIRLALATRPQVCLIDLLMPGGGLGAIREISARLPDTPVVVLTASDRDADLFAALRNGAKGFLRKDASFTELPALLEAARRGDAAIPASLVARMVEQFHGRAPSHRPVTDDIDDVRLTPREWQVMEGLVSGMTTTAVAEGLGISPSSVRVHLHAVVGKLGAASRAEAIARFRAARADPAD